MHRHLHLTTKHLLLCFGAQKLSRKALYTAVKHCKGSVLLKSIGTNGEWDIDINNIVPFDLLKRSLILDISSQISKFCEKEEIAAKAMTGNPHELEKKGRKRQIEEKVADTKNTEIREVSAGKKSKKSVLKSSKPKPSTDNLHKENKKELKTIAKNGIPTNVSKPAITDSEEITERDVKLQSVVNNGHNVEEVAEKSKPKGKGKKVVQQKTDKSKSNGATNEKTESDKIMPLAEIPKTKDRQKRNLVESTTGETSSDIVRQKDLKADSKVKEKVEKPGKRGRAKNVGKEKDSVENNFSDNNRRMTFIIETNKIKDNIQNNPEQANSKSKSKQQKDGVNKTEKTIEKEHNDNNVAESIDPGNGTDNVTAVKNKETKKPEKKKTTSRTKKKQAVFDSQKNAETSTSRAGDNKTSKTTTSRKRGTVKTSEEAPTKKHKSEKTLKNKAATDYDSVDFSNVSKDSKGNPWNIKICSWNVDGIRAWVTKGGLDYIKYEKPDILCLQEVKCAQDKLPAEAASVPGYHAYWLCSDKDGYAGVGIYTTKLAINVQYGLENEELDAEGRIITAEYEQFYLICTYVPNAGRGLVTLDKKLRWNDAFRSHVNGLDRTKPVIICGDMNVAHQEIDLKNPKSNKKNAGFTPEERAGMTALLADGYTDTFRHLYPDRTDAYTFWTYMMGARSKNIGWRLDYVIVSERLAPAVCDSVIRSDVYGSDHCPIALCLHLTGSPKIPSQETP